MTSVTDEEYHLTFGLHSGIPLCCAIEFSDGGKGGPCPPCKEKGVVSKEMFAKLHTCHENNPACVPYLQLIELRAFSWFTNHRDKKPVNLVKGEQDDFTWGTNLFMPMGGEFRDALKDARYRLVHICWPEPSVYWYIFQQAGGKKGVCGICNTKFSLSFPTTGKQSK
jgi:hypothetical protein